MPTLKLHYEGWVSLPVALRQQLGLNSGDRLDVELVDGTIMLRPTAKVRRPAPRAGRGAVIEPPAVEIPEPLTHADTTPARRKPGRPRRQEAGDELAATTSKRPRGRPRSAGAPQPEPAPVGTGATRNEPWKLRRKADLQPRAASVEHAPLPSPRPFRARSEAGSPAEERRPFHNVEVRKLGPGRRHNRPQAVSWPARLPT